MKQENEPKPRQPRHYDTREEFDRIANLDPKKSRAFLENEGLTPGSGDVEVWIAGQKYLMSTEESDFGTLIAKLE